MRVPSSCRLGPCTSDCERGAIALDIPIPWKASGAVKLWHNDEALVGVLSKLPGDQEHIFGAAEMEEATYASERHTSFNIWQGT